MLPAPTCAHARGRERLGPGPGRIRTRLLPVALALLAAGGAPPARAVEAAAGGLGLPFTRFYSFEEIGGVSRGARLGFDPLGRIAVTRSGACVVLNDTTWHDLSDREPDGPVMQRLVFGPDGQAYYGAFGSWGTAAFVDGRLRPRPLAPADLPRWVATTNLSDIVAVDAGVYFAGLGGVVYWDRATGAHSYIPVAGLTRIFALGQRLYVASYTEGLGTIDLAARSLVRLLGPEGAGSEIDQVTAFDAGRVLVSTRSGELRFFDGAGFAPFPGPLGAPPRGRITALVRQPDGNVALAIDGIGLHLVAADGRILSALTTPEYHRVTDLAAREDGVLWLVNESGIAKILYGSPLTVFGQRLGLPLSWPQLVRWQDRIVVASGGRLYETSTGRPGETARFQLLPGQPTDAVWGLATAGDELLIGTKQGVFVRNGTGGFDSVLPGLDAARLVHVDGVVYCLGATEIAALHRVAGAWREAAPRIPGLGYPFVVHGTDRACWIELGPNRAAQVRLAGGRLDTRLFEDFPWKDPRWVNVGWAGNLVALASPDGHRLYFDEQAGTPVAGHELDRALALAPYPLTRFRQDRAGTIWATHERGLLTIRPHGPEPRVDSSTFGRIDDPFPLLRLLPGDDVWLATGPSLYHVNRPAQAARKPAFQPTLVSLTTGRTGRELLPRPGAAQALPLLPHDENSLVLRFFAGSYASRHPPAYEFRVHRGNDRWVALGNGSLLTLPDLREGAYRLEVRLTDSRESLGAPLTLAFTVAPPWFRTWYAYAGYALAAAAVLYGLLRWLTHRTHARNVALERLVAERTEELRRAMQQLNEETRLAATLAERDRLAGEIHDSLQQGLSGLMLQLDATLKLPDLPADVRSRLGVARNMVSFTRHEVQHAVWDMETPLLAGTELGEALRKLAALIDPGTAAVRLTVTGRPVELSSSSQHHLLRIAQEALTNAVRHAAARTITISLAYAPAGVTLSVGDDGNGFLPAEVLTKGLGHFGLRGLRGRAGKVGGELILDSSPGCGTTVRVTVPAPTPAPADAR